MMILFLAVTGAIIVAASYISKRDSQKRMKQLRAEEAAFKEKVSRFRAREVETVQAENPDAVFARLVRAKECVFFGGGEPLFPFSPAGLGNAAGLVFVSANSPGLAASPATKVASATTRAAAAKALSKAKPHR
ncbi:hypothetical protein NKH72_21680 [Mesorhizobium sp. M0955]|uniref:hypothetical protein n=1 Tax=Mesorhizobium sp. M0955 TaxID=2957033 RepID=UPI00333D2DCA